MSRCSDHYDRCGMGYRHSKEHILEGALLAVFDDGLSRLSFGRLARRLGISDRTIVYYFPSKDDLIAEVLASLGHRLQATLAPTLTEPVDDHHQVVAKVWPLVASEDADPVFALFFEAAGLAAAGVEPYRDLAPRLTQGWIDWAASLVRGTSAHRRAEAAAAIAALDGLLLLRQLVGPDAANRAARRIAAR